MFNNKLNANIEILEKENQDEFVRSWDIDRSFSTKINDQKSDFHDEKEKMLFELFDFSKRGVYESEKQDVEQASLADSKILIRDWNNSENIHARLIEVTGTTVVLECLVDKENKIYEEREFDKDLFDGYEIKEGYFFLLRFYTRKNEMKLEVHDNKSGLVKDEHFKSINLYEAFKNNPIFKK
ncbi:MAG: hypothetical protein U9Q98_08590 [Bacteroidota bacterium]|nr:hypothetical protein [Bacteroidota bacterium]